MFYVPSTSAVMSGQRGGGGGGGGGGEYNKVQACFVFETFYSKFLPILGLYQGLPGQHD